MRSFYFFSKTLLIFGISISASAVPLGMIPNIDTEYLRIDLDVQSDVWTSANSQKNSPVRIFGSELRIPVAHGEGWKISVNLNEESLSLSQTELNFKNRNIFIGNNLQSQAAGLGYSHQFNDKSYFNIMGHYSSDSDVPFTDRRNRYFEGSAIYVTSDHFGYQWLVALNQSENRGLANGRPFPYLGIILNNSETFHLSFGFPYIRAIWSNPGVWKYEAFMTPFGAYIDSERPIKHGFSWHARSSFSMRAYMHENREDNESRIYYQQLTAEGGLKKTLTTQTAVEFSLGYAFDRKIFESDSVYTPHADKTDLGSDIFARFRIGFTIL